MKLIFGTVQIGLNYGITNTTGKPSRIEALEILYYCINNGIDTFDTAQLYGDSENIIGDIIEKYPNIKVITKLSLNDNIDNIDNLINTSLINLKKDYIDILLLHNFKHYDTSIWHYLVNKYYNNIIKNLGVSVYYVNEAIIALQDVNITYIQIPFNFLDKQWLNQDFINLIKKRNIKILCRSIFLQGILLTDDSNKWPKIENINPQNYINKINYLVKLFKFNNKIQLCISFVKSFDWIDGIIFGAETLDQVKDNISNFNIRKLEDHELIHFNIFNNIPHQLINPSLW